MNIRFAYLTRAFLQSNRHMDQRARARSHVNPACYANRRGKVSSSV